MEHLKLLVLNVKFFAANGVTSRLKAAVGFNRMRCEILWLIKKSGYVVGANPARGALPRISLAVGFTQELIEVLLLIKALRQLLGAYTILSEAAIFVGFSLQGPRREENDLLIPAQAWGLASRLRR